jgi:hypothetical protein
MDPEPAHCHKYAANAIQGTSLVHKSAVLIERASSCISKKLDAGHVGSPSLTFRASHCKILVPGSERADELAARGKANLRCTVGRLKTVARLAQLAQLPLVARRPLAARSRLSSGRDFESARGRGGLVCTLGVFADRDDGAFAFGSGRDIELGARILYDHCVRWGMIVTKS